jgi:tetratricopeptide (TPR) repeat protein
MTTLILCGMTDNVSRDFLDAERVILEDTIVKMNWKAEHIHTLRLKELPFPAEKEKINNLCRELLTTFGLETLEFQTEFLMQGESVFLAIYTTADKPTTADIVPVSQPKPEHPVFRFPWKGMAIGAGVIALLVLLYYGMGFVLTRQVDGQYTGRECQKVVELAELVQKAYPLKIAPFTEPALGQSRECQAYLSADDLYRQKKWEKAYQSYWAYTKGYPTGIFSKESTDLAADSLFAWASEQRENREFAGSVDALKLLLKYFGNTPSMPQAREILPQVYLEWGVELRSKTQFSEAEMVYLSLGEWAQSENDQFHIASATAELAQTYFDWGMDLVRKNDFELAETRFARAMSIDPNAKDANSPAIRAHDYMPDFHRAWGKYLISRENYKEAIGHYETSIELSKAEDVTESKNILAQVYLDWASFLHGRGDYYQALDKITLSKESAVTDDARTKADAERVTVIDQFSRSIGTQAREIISDATQIVCSNGKPDDPLHIIGILENKRLTLSGLSLTLPGDILAQSPGSLYFVACGEEKTVKVQSCPYRLIGSGGGATYWIERIRYDWVIKVYRAQTGKLYKQKTIQGSTPESCPYTHSFSIGTTTHYHYGNNPSTVEALDWLASLLK